MSAIIIHSRCFITSYDIRPFSLNNITIPDNWFSITTIYVSEVTVSIVRV